MRLALACFRCTLSVFVNETPVTVPGRSAKPDLIGGVGTDSLAKRYPAFVSQTAAFAPKPRQARTKSDAQRDTMGGLDMNERSRR